MAAKSYFVNGKKVSFTDKDYKATGGEGIIYTKGGTVYKIFLDQSHQTPLAKVEELNRLLNRTNILKPKELIYDDKNAYVGFTMDYADDTQPLCRTFTTSYRNQFGITPDITLKFVERFQQDLHYIHQQKCLVVDCSEFNFLANKNLSEVYFIDTNSYQTPSFPATAITPGITDYHTKGFSELTDWFSFAILACQLFVGIHPYKGTHPNFKANEFIERMKKNISIFNNTVTIPSAARDFSLIPTEYMRWFVNLFEKGQRTPPPSIAGTMNIAAFTTIVQSSGKLELTLIKEFKENVRNFFSYLASWAAVLDTTIEFNNGKTVQIKDKNALVQFTQSLDPIIVQSYPELDFSHFNTKYNRFNTTINSMRVKISNKFITDNKIYVTFDDKLIEMSSVELGDKTAFSGTLSRDFLINSSTVFDGVIYQDTLGVPYLIIPYIKNGISCCMISPFNELKGYKIVSAKHDDGVIMVVGFKNNCYDKFIFKVDNRYSTYGVSRIIKDVQSFDLNFVTLENGIVAHIQEDGELEIFSKRIDRDELKIVKDPQIKMKMILYKLGSKVVFTIENRLYTMTLK